MADFPSAYSKLPSEISFQAFIFIGWSIMLIFLSVEGISGQQARTECLQLFFVLPEPFEGGLGIHELDFIFPGSYRA